MRYKYSNELIIKALTESFGGVYLAAKKIGGTCCAQTIYDRMAINAEVRKVKDSFLGELKDIGKLKLRELALAGDRWAVGYVLNMDDEYRKEDRLKLEHSGEQNIILTWEEPNGYAEPENNGAEDAPEAGGDIQEQDKI